MKLTIEANGNVTMFEVDANKLDFIRRVLACEQPFAMKLWDVEDIRNCAECYYDEIGLTDCEIDEVLNTMNMDVLEECTEEEWGTIAEAVRTVRKCD